MPAVLGNIIALALVALLIFVCARYLITHRHEGCTGDCGSCGAACSSAEKMSEERLARAVKKHENSHIG
ncbi:MAG: FeoB-associated Cys-rich membrane protein [Lachnospiraceae bacterium]|jgi:cobalamin synthase